MVDSVQEYLPLNMGSEDPVEDGKPPPKGKQKSLVHFDVIFGGYTHETAFPVSFFIIYTTLTHPHSHENKVNAFHFL